MGMMLNLTAKAIYNVAQSSSGLYCFLITYEPKIPAALKDKNK